MKSIIFAVFKKIIGSKGFELYKSFKSERRRQDLRKAKGYLYHQGEILERVTAMNVKKIVFFVLNMDMWKYDGLIHLLNNDERFDITIISFDMPQLDSQNSKKHQKQISEYCRQNGLKFIPGYDYRSGKFADISSLNPDIVSYTQPYNNGYTPWLIDAFKDNSLFIYTPYGASVAEGRYFHDTYLTNIAWKVFVGSEMEKDYINKCLSVNSNNQVVTGYPIYDRLCNPKKEMNPWHSQKKKVIWAPHHSIDNRYSFSSSNFERICYQMIILAKEFEDKIEFAFKPHPMLKERLIEKWGREKTEEYYCNWMTMPNTFISEGDYAELFAYSDGLIHDCGSFVCEYLLTGKPALYVVRDSSIPESVNNENGIQCFNQHYHALGIEEIENFLLHNILKGEDPLKDQRTSFVNNSLLPPGGYSVGQNMMNELLKLINK